MNNLFKYLRLLLLATSGVLLLCMIFAINPELAHGTIMGRVCWFHFASFLFAISILFMEFTKKKSHFVFSLPDGLFLLLFGLMLNAYDKELNLQPERLFFFTQLGVLWFMLRSAIQVYQKLRIFFITLIMFTGTVAAKWGIGVLLGNEPSTHPLLNLLHESMRPEPFVGYMAIILPICLNCFLRFRNCNKLAWWETRTFLFYLSIIGTILISTALLLSLNRPVWVAAILSCLWVIWMRMIGWRRTKEAINRHQRLFAFSSIFFFILISGIILTLNIKKADAGNRRLLIWNVTTKAIVENPINGTGIGSFPTVYARTQANYFKSETASENEKINAICPTVAYNEYLLIGLEMGIIGLLFFLLWLAYSLYYGIKHRQFGASGGILALAIFSLYSYPLQYPTFWVLLIFLSVICTTQPRRILPVKHRSIPYIGILAALTTCIIFFEQKDTFYTYKEWKNLKDIFQDRTYTTASIKYPDLYDRLCHRTDFLYEGAYCLDMAGKHDVAVLWIKRAMQLSSDPNLYYAMARYQEKMGQYREAEHYLLEITQILPRRGYAYYMLTRLYANPGYFKPDKLRETVRIFESLQSIRQSGITPQMQEKVRHILQKSIPEPEQTSLSASPSDLVSNLHQIKFSQNPD